MRTKNNFILLLLSFTTLLAITSCSKEDNQLSEPPRPKEYTVSLAYSGEITKITESPLSRGEENTDLYGIQVYSKPANDTSTPYTQYAYGLFDNIAAMNIKLLDGYLYQFVATAIVDAKNKLRDGGRWVPFYLNNGTQIQTINIFDYGSDKGLDGLGYGSTFLLDKIYYRPNVERYYGELSDYQPTENGTANIRMIRTVFGLKVVAKNLTEGTLSIKMEEAPEIKLTYPQTEVSNIYTFSGKYDNGVKLAWMNPDTYSENVPILFSWVKADGVVVPIESKTITFKRNIETTVEITLSESSISNGIGISKESETLKTGETVKVGDTESSNNNVVTAP